MKEIISLPSHLYEELKQAEDNLIEANKKLNSVKRKIKRHMKIEYDKIQGKLFED